MESTGFLVTSGESKGSEHFRESLLHFMLALTTSQLLFKTPLSPYRPRSSPDLTVSLGPRQSSFFPSNESNPSSALPIPLAEIPLPFLVPGLKLCQFRGTSWLRLPFPNPAYGIHFSEQSVIAALV